MCVAQRDQGASLVDVSGFRSFGVRGLKRLGGSGQLSNSLPTCRLRSTNSNLHI